jgi:hypothetical protein
MAEWRLSQQEREAWEREGFFVRPRAFAPDELETLRKAAERVVAWARALQDGRSYRIDGNPYRDFGSTTIQYEHAPGSDTLRVIEPFHTLDPVFEALVDDARLVEPMRDLVGAESVALFTDKLNLKRPREGSRFRWHQDSPYWFMASPHLDRLPNVMLALDDAGEENGCFRVIRGSHRRGLLPGLPGDGQLGPLFTDPRCFDLADEVAVAMPAGSLVFFSPHTVHGSQPNRSARQRRALVLTYQPAGHRMLKIDAERVAGGATL